MTKIILLEQNITDINYVQYFHDMELAVHPNELMIFYNRESPISKKTIAFAQSVCDHIREIEYKNLTYPDTIWKELLDLLKMRPQDLINESHADYEKKIKGEEVTDFTDADWLKVISHNPQLIKGPIAVKNKKAVLCRGPKDVLKVDGKEEKAGN